MRRVTFIALFALMAAGLLFAGCKKPTKPKKKAPPVKWSDYSSASIGVKFKKPDDFTKDPSAKGTYTDGSGIISASFTKGEQSLDQIIASEITRKQKDTQANFKKRKLSNWQDAFKVIRKERMKIDGKDAVELEISLAKQAKENPPMEHRMEVWVKTADGLITVAWFVEEGKWKKYYSRYFKKSRASLKITK